MDQSKFYRWRPAEAFMYGRNLDFPFKVQLTYPLENKAMLFEAGQEEFWKNDELGHHDQYDGTDLLLDPEQYVDSDI